MHGRKAYQLVKEFVSGEKGYLKIFNNELFERVVEECNEHHNALHMLCFFRNIIYIVMIGHILIHFSIRLWKVFYDDKDRLGRYLLAKELVIRPYAEDLEIIYENAEEKSEQGPSMFSQAASIFSSMNRFMRTISK